jgi:hypothetical protein
MTTKTETLTAPAQREVLPIKPTSVRLNAANYCNKEWIVHGDAA